ncbi:CLUMA_CG013074, isoform A [Clunio marinus]|uniref:CLUMA_CG013074, isoform A n=1 Tax=Clunio marinus TaxID=568069 RepID=A0A1J1IHH8_9DIPT|nr:CLUMA_CG013074, isoform A [Clunio marinus]
MVIDNSQILKGRKVWDKFQVPIDSFRLVAKNIETFRFAEGYLESSIVKSTKNSISTNLY